MKNSAHKSFGSLCPFWFLPPTLAVSRVYEESTSSSNFAMFGTMFVPRFFVCAMLMVSDRFFLLQTNIGMVMTVAQPVFNRSRAAVSEHDLFWILVCRYLLSSCVEEKRQLNWCGGNRCSYCRRQDFDDSIPGSYILSRRLCVICIPRYYSDSGEQEVMFLDLIITDMYCFIRHGEPR